MRWDYRDLLEERPPWLPPSCYAPNVVLLDRCPVCAEWMPAGSRGAGRCGACGIWIPEELKRITEQLRHPAPHR